MNPIPTRTRYSGLPGLSSLKLAGFCISALLTCLDGPPLSVAGGYDPRLYSIAVQPDGKIVLGGSITTLGGVQRNALARLNPDLSLDLSFNPGANYAVFSLTVLEDGKILAGGGFSQLAGSTCHHLGRLEADGSLDTTFNAGVDSWVRGLAVQADGKIVIGGYFRTVGGEPRTNIARLNGDGTLDSDFNPTANGSVETVAIQADGKILVGGEFTTLCSQQRPYLARLNSDGSLDTAFDPRPNSRIESLALQADGKMLVGGPFTSMGGQPHQAFARLSPAGLLDDGFAAYANGTVHSIAILIDGKILVGGEFTSLCGQPRARVGKVNSDGSLDTSFNPGADGSVFGLTVASDGKVLVAGFFHWLDSQWCEFFGRLSSSGSADASLNFDGSNINWLRGGTGPEVWRTKFDISTNGVDWSPLGEGLRAPSGWQLAGVSIPSDCTVRARGYVSGGFRNASGWFVEEYLSKGKPMLYAQPEGRTVAAGAITRFSVGVRGEEALHYQWLKFGLPLQDGGNITGALTPMLTVSSVQTNDAGPYQVVITNQHGSVTSAVALLTVTFEKPFLASQPANRTNYRGTTALFSVDAGGSEPLGYTWFKSGVPLQDTVNISGAVTSTLTLTNIQHDDAGAYQVVVTNLYGSITSAVASLTVRTPFPVALDSGFNPDADAFVCAIAVQPNGQILVGGNFSTIGDQPRAYIARLDPGGQVDPSFDPGSDMLVVSLAVQSDGKVLVGGFFGSIAGQVRKGLARLNVDGSLDAEFNPRLDACIYAVVLQPDGKILAGGDFMVPDTQKRPGLVRLNENGSLDESFFLPTEPAALASLALQADGKIVVGGNFTSWSGQPRQGLARLNADGTLDPAFTVGANQRVGTLAIQADGKILVGGSFTSLGGQSRTGLGRLNEDGTLDVAFKPVLEPADGPDICSLAVQEDGRIIIGGWFSSVDGEPRLNVARLHPDGTPDLELTVGVEEGDHWAAYVRCLAIQADGNILVGGPFHMLAGETRNYLGRLRNGESPVETHTWEGSRLTWCRTGTSPEVSYTTFEICTNGSDWTFMGQGTRAGNGWEWSGLPLLPNAIGRTRGYLSGADGNGSCWFVESLATNRPETEFKLECVLNEGQPVLVLRGPPGSGYGIQMLSSFATGTWTTALTNLALTNTWLRIPAPGTNENMKLYRAFRPRSS